MSKACNLAPRPTRTCSHCGTPFASPQRFALFCSRKCKTDAANLEAARGKQLYRLAYHWRAGNGPSFSDLSWLIDQFRKEDRETGRVPPPREPAGMTVAQSYMTKRQPKVARERRLGSGL